MSRFCPVLGTREHLCLCTSLYDSVSVKRSWRLRERILLHFLYLHVYGEGTHVCGHASTCAHAQRGQGTTFGICPSQKHPLAFEVWFLIVLELAQLAVSEASLADQQAPDIFLPLPAIPGITNEFPFSKLSFT